MSSDKRSTVTFADPDPTIMSESGNSQSHVVIIGGGLSLMSLLKQLSGSMGKIKPRITVVQGCDYLEWSLSSTYFLANPDKHNEYLATDQALFQHSFVDEYIYMSVTDIDLQSKIVTGNSSRYATKSISYDFLVVATGFHLPLLNPTPGMSLSERKNEIQLWGNEISKSNGTIVINGPGAIGLELAGDIRIKNPNTRVIILSRSGKICEAHPENVQELVKNGLKMMNIELIRGEINEVKLDSKKSVVYGGAEIDNDKAKRGMLPIYGGGSIMFKNSGCAGFDGKFDILLPGFAQGPSTSFLASQQSNIRDPKSGFLQTNPFLQLEQYPNVYAIGVNSTNEGFVGPKLEGQCVTVAKNIKTGIKNQDNHNYTKHKPAFGASMNVGKRPMTIKIGNGPGSYIFWDNLPQPMKCCSYVCGPPFCFIGCCLAGPCKPNPGCCLCGKRPCKIAEGFEASTAFGMIAGIGGIKMFPKNMGGKRYDCFGIESTENGAPKQQKM